MEIGQRLPEGGSPQPGGAAGQVDAASAPINELDLKLKVVEVLDRWPSAGLAVVLVRDGSLEGFLGHGVADVESKEPITEDTVFRIGSITKTFTAIAVMQLCERGLVDLDAPANDYLRTFRLVPAKPSFRPTVRHLLTHTAVIAIGGGCRTCFSPVSAPATGPGDRAPRRSASTTAEACRSRSSREPSGPIATTGSRRSGRSSRTSAASRSRITCASGSSNRWGWTTST